MKKRLVFLLSFIFSLSFIACDTKNKTNQFSISIDAVIQQNDSIRVFYTTDTSINFVEEKSIWKEVKGLNKNQEIIIKIPENDKPTQIRIDFGNNTLNKEIVLNKVTTSYFDKKFQAKGEEIYWYFRPDENNTILDQKSGILQRKDSTQSNGPSLYPKGDKLREQLNLLYKKEKNVQ